MLDPDVLSLIPSDTFFDFSRHLFPHLLANEGLYACELDGYWCDIGSLTAYRNAHFDALMGKAHLDICANEVEKGVWLGRGVNIHKTAQLTAPVFVGDGVSIRKGAILGGFSVIGDGTLVDEEALIERSILGSRAFVGRATQISDSVVGDGYHVEENNSVWNRAIVDGAEKQIYPIWDLPGAAAPEPERLWASQSPKLAA